ncbi:MAG: PilZ domain-containing protein [Treponema sp.]|jgi:c-di-GMP-binding flagellar brake protein YcgR|nr:PilZ domain-containing protein [Treponema sp.]
MATEIKRIEKESILSTLHNKRISMSSLIERNDYSFTLIEVNKTALSLVPDRPLPEIAAAHGKKLNLMANHMGMNIFFTVEIKDTVKERLITTAPESLYRNLGRSNSRQAFPSDMSMQFASLEEKFILPFPLLEQEDVAAPLPGLEKSDYNAIVTHLAKWVKTIADAYKLTLFRDAKASPLEFEKSLMMKIGKTLFLPSIEAGLPELDETPEKRLITTELFRKSDIASDQLTQFIQTKHDEGLRSCVWVPLFFERYVIGCIQLWVSAEDKAPLGIEHISTLYQYGKSLSAALVARGYFASCSVKNKFFQGNGVDISASGILFSYPLSSLTPAFTKDKEIALKLNTGSQIINSSARIIRYYRERAVDYWGCRFVGMSPEDSRTLIEYLYGKPFEQLKTTLMLGQA